MQVCGCFQLASWYWFNSFNRKERRFTAAGVTSAMPCITVGIIRLCISTSICLYTCVLFFLVYSNKAEVNGTFHCHKECTFLDFRVHSVVAVQNSSKILASGVWARYHPWLSLGKGSMLYQRVISNHLEGWLLILIQRILSPPILNLHQSALPFWGDWLFSVCQLGTKGNAGT